MSKTRRTYYSRNFLNPVEAESDEVWHGGGLAAYEVTCEEYKRETESDDDEDSLSYSHSVDCSISITDCYRKVTLDFEAGNKTELKQRLHKIDTLIKELNEIKKYLKNTKFKK